MNRLLATVANEFEADILVSRMTEAGIRAWPSGAGSFGREGGGARRDVYVDGADLEKAHKALAEAQSTSEDELIELSERSSPPPD